MAGLGGQAQLDKIFFFLGEGVHGQAHGFFNARNGGLRQRRGFGGHHKPHIQAVGAAVVVRHLGEAIDHGIDHIKALFGHGDGRQHKLAPSAFDLEQGAKAGEHAPRQQLVQALDDALFAPAQLRPNGGKGALIQRKTAVQVVDQ